MEDEPKGSDEEQDGAQNTSKEPEPSFTQKKAATNAHAEPTYESNESTNQPKPKTRWNRLWAWASDLKSSDVIMAFLTLVIAGTGVIGIILVIQGGEDSRRLADAADRQACAASRFASSAASINSGIGEAVAKLSTQADQMKRAADAARGAADTASRQLEATDRPWIKIIGAVADHPVTYHTNGGITTHGNDLINLGIKVIVQNVGKSAALDVVTRADVIFVSMISGASNDPFTYPLAIQKKLCSKPAKFGLPINLFPGEDNREQSGDDHDIPTAEKKFVIPQDADHIPRLMPYFVGCVDYKIGVSGKVHQSRFIYSVEQVLPNDPYHNRGMLILGNDIPMADIRLVPFAFGGFDAN